MEKWIETFLLKAAVVFLVLLFVVQVFMLSDTARQLISIVDQLEGEALP